MHHPDDLHANLVGQNYKLSELLHLCVTLPNLETENALPLSKNFF